MTIQISGYTYDKHGIGSACLVRGVAKRAIRVVLRPNPRKGYVDKEYVIELAAKLAAKHNWKTVYVDPDDYGYGHLWAFNSHQYFIEYTRNGYFGKFLCMAKSTPEAEKRTQYKLPYTEDSYYYEPSMADFRCTDID